MDIKNGVDVSSFLLVEDSGDSEADNGLYKMCNNVVLVGGDHDDDDAESSSCETSDHVCFHNKDFDCDYDDCFDLDGDDGQCEQSWCSCKRWWSDAAAAWGYMSTEEGEEESSVDVNCISRKVMDAMEDRLFWETCMAVGYPQY